MNDMEKIIKGLEICYCPPAKCEDCPYNDLPDEQSCNDTLCLDALALLKKQEEVVPEIEHSGSGITWWNICGNCKTAINPNDKYCHECGRAVKW